MAVDLQFKMKCRQISTCRQLTLSIILPGALTVVLKNSLNINPVLSPDTTLFVKQQKYSSQPHGFDRKDRYQGNAVTPVPLKITTAGQKTKEMKLQARIQCVQKTLKTYQDARRSREKRLMAHMGLKGTLSRSYGNAHMGLKGTLSRSYGNAHMGLKGTLSS